MKKLILLLFLSFIWSWSVFGQQEDEKKRTSINFEDELIQGEVNKPELLYLLQQKQFNYRRLIKLRKNFIPELKATSESIPRTGD